MHQLTTVMGQISLDMGIVIDHVVMLQFKSMYFHIQSK